MAYHLKLEQYQGPIEKLLELIEERKLPIEEISLAQVTDDFVRHVESITAAYKAEDAGDGGYTAASYMRLLSDFIVVASRLIFIKSKSLLPDMVLSDEEEGAIKDLETRLAMYRDFKPAMKLVMELWRSGSRVWSRPYFLHARKFLMKSALEEEGKAKFFFPGEGVTPQALSITLTKLLTETEIPVLEKEVVRESIVSLEETIQELGKRMNALKEIKFAQLLGAASRAEIIVAFLAILHLAREQAVSLEQKEGDSDIIIRKQHAL